MLRIGRVRWAAPLGVAGILAVAGCYHHVVGVSGGTGPDRRVIYEPNLDPDERIPLVDDLGDAVLGKPEKR